MKKKLLNSMRVLLAAAGLCVGASAWADTTITYDFQAYAKVKCPSFRDNVSLTLGTTEATKNNGTSVYLVKDLADFSFGGNFAFQDTKFCFRNGSSKNNDANKGITTAGNDRYFSIMNLLKGDKVIITCNEGVVLFVSTNATYDNSGTATAVTKWLAVTSDKEYTMSEDGPLHLQFKGKDNSSATLLKVQIITSRTETMTSGPSISDVANGEARTVTITNGVSSLNSNVTTYYTTDGNTPTASSTKYTGSFDVTETCTVKAITISNSSAAAGSSVTSYLVNMESIETPTAAITGVNGTKRTITFSCATAGTTLSYSTDGGSTFTEGNSVEISSNTTFIVRASKNEAHEDSEALAFEAGTAVNLNAPSVTPTTLEQAADALYYPTVNASYDAAGVLLTPSATLTATFNGEAVNLPYTPTTVGTLAVTASYDGYTSATTEYAVKGYAMVLWYDYTTATTSGLPSGIRKWSDDSHWELAEGYGYKAIREGSNAWLQINKAGMVAYEKLSEASAEATATLNIVATNDNTGNNSSIGFAYGTVISKVYYFTEGRSVAVSSVGYATLCPTVNLDFSGITEVEACTAAVAADGKITYTPVTTVANGEGVLLRTANGLAATIGVPVKTDATEANAGNAFVGIPEKVQLAQSTESGYTNYILSKVDDVLGFYKVNANGSWCNAGTAYLKVANSVSPARGFFTLWNDEATGINAVTESKAVEGQAYNLNGQRVAEPAKGLYIVNGKKVIIK